MDIPILVEPLDQGGFRAQTGSPFNLMADGATATEAAESLSQLLRARLTKGAQLVIVSLPNGSPGVTASPLPADDLYKTDWVYRELQEAIAEQRRQEEAAGP